MALKAYVSVEKDVLLPAVLGLIVVAITVVTLYILRRKKIAGSGQGGTEYVTSLDGQTVRRSTRRAENLAHGKTGCFGLYAKSSVLLTELTQMVVCRSRKSVARWSPDDLASPTGYGTPKTPKPAEKVRPRNIEPELAGSFIRFCKFISGASGGHAAIAGHHNE